MKKVTVTSRYKLYVRGEFVREVEYRFETDKCPENRTRVRAATNAELEQANSDRTAAEESFEALVDAAGEV